MLSTQKSQRAKACMNTESMDCASLNVQFHQVDCPIKRHGMGSPFATVLIHHFYDGNIV